MRETKVNFDGHYPCATRNAEKEYGLVPDVSFDKYYRRFHLMPLIRRLCNSGFIYAFTARNSKLASYVKKEIYLYYLYCTEHALKCCRIVAKEKKMILSLMTKLIENNRIFMKFYFQKKLKLVTCS